MKSFIFGGDTGLTYEDLKSRQAYADNMMKQGGAGQPRTAMQGVNSAAKSIMGALLAKKLGATEKAERDKFNDQFNGIIGGMGGGQSTPPFVPSAPTAQPAPSAAQALPTGGPDVPAPTQDGFSMGVIETAQALGMDPVDLATMISYETAGTFDPTKAGPTTQWGQHRGLIQFGEPQAKQYGVDWDDPIGSQLGKDGAIAKYFRENGWKPGMGIMDAYSIINAGAPGKYNASDASNGGAPGTVADKVNNQMRGHREKAQQLLAGQYQPQPQRTAGIDPRIMQAMTNPYATDAQRSVLGMLMQQQIANSQPQDPMKALQMQNLQSQIDQRGKMTPYQQAQIDMQRQKLEAGPGGTEFGLTPQYGVDEEGNPVLIQIGKDGTATQTKLPEGVTFQKEPIKVDAGTDWILLDPISREPVGRVSKNLGAAESEKVQGRLEGEAAATAKNDLGGVAAQASEGINLINSIVNDPALSGITGMVQGNLPPMSQAGTDLNVKIKQLKGKAFLSAFESLKGGGAISEREGAAASDAMARLDRAQSTEAYVEALNELATILQAGVERVQRKAGVAPAATGAPQQGTGSIPPAPSGFDPARWPQVWEAMPEEDKRL